MILTKIFFLNWMTSVEEDMTKKLLKERFKLDVRKFAFSNRIVSDWNSSSSQ